MRFDCLNCILVGRGSKASSPNSPLPPARPSGFPKLSTTNTVVLPGAPATCPQVSCPKSLIAATASQTVPRPTTPEAPTPGVTNSPPPASRVIDAFAEALGSHIAILSDEERRIFGEADQISSEELLARVQKLDETHSQRSIFRRHEKIKAFLDVLQVNLGSLSVFIGGGLGISSLVHGAVKLVVEFGIKFFSFFNKLTSMMEHLAEHLGYLNTYARVFTSSLEVQNALCGFYGDLLKFCQGVRKVFIDKVGNQSRFTSFMVFLKITWAPFESEFDDISARLDDRVLVVLRTAQVSEHERTRIERQKKAQAKAVKERRQMLGWLGKLSGLNYHTDHVRIFEKWHEGTGDWLFQSDEFGAWRDEKKSCLLWCYGNPGVGKSVLTSRVLEKISEEYAADDSTGIGFAYFNFQDSETQKYDKVLAALVKQLCHKRKAFPDRLKGFYQSSETPSHQDLLAQLIDLSKAFDQVFIILDAMDECEDRSHFLPFVSGLSRESSCDFKIFVTSRMERDIETEFTGEGFPTIRIEATKVNDDIKSFVHTEVERRICRGNRCVIGPELKSKIEEALCSQANGMFLWVTYQIDFIFQLPSTQDIETNLNSLPEDMNATYLRILRMIDKQNKATKDLARRALMWVVTAGRLLSPLELADAVAIRPECRDLSDINGKYGPQTIIEACRNLMTIESNQVRLVHNTVQEFLTSPPSTDTQARGDTNDYQVTREKSHLELAQGCIQFMRFSVDRLVKRRAADCEIDQPVVGGKLWLYVVNFFDYHILAIDHIPKDLLDLFEKFLSHERSLKLVLRSRTTCDVMSVNALSFCMTFNLLHMYRMSGRVDMTVANPLTDGMVLHQAASAGSAEAIQKLLDSGFCVDAPDPRGIRPLYYAAEGGHERAVKILVNRGADVNAQGGFYGNALQAAAYQGNQTIAKMLLEKGADVNTQGGFYGNALQAAAYQGNQTIAQMLLDKGADVNTQGGEYGTALQAAARQGNQTIAQILLEKGADVNAQGGEYDTALEAAAYQGNQTIAQMLLDKGADVNAQGGYFGNALQTAASRGSQKIAQMLLDKGADVNAQGGYFGNALQAAALSGGLTMVQMLLGKGADVNMQGGEYGTALQAAAVSRNQTIAQMLLDNGADVNAQGGVNGNALQAAASRGSQEITQILLDKGADVNAQGGANGSALQAAVRSRNQTIAQMLLDKGADVNAEGGFYGNALQAAVSLDSQKIAQMLLDNGADVNAQDGEFGNALLAAVSRGNQKIAQMLLDKGADVNAQGGEYGTALQAAAREGDETVSQMLLDNGADVHAQGGFYGNALHVAASRGNQTIAQMFLDKGADVNAQGGYFGNALQAAALSGGLTMVQMLLGKGADVNMQGGEYGTALQAAALSRNQTIAQILLDNGADANAQGGEYGTALQAAVSQGSQKIAQMLLDNGADVNAQGGEFGNALQAAMSLLGCDMKDPLVKAGAKRNQKSDQGSDLIESASN